MERTDEQYSGRIFLEWVERVVSSQPHLSFPKPRRKLINFPIRSSEVELHEFSEFSRAVHVNLFVALGTGYKHVSVCGIS